MLHFGAIEHKARQRAGGARSARNHSFKPTWWRETMGSSMGMSAEHLLPSWLRMVWIAICAVILILHLRHAFSMRGQRRIWHSGHSLMALGMMYMFLPGGILALPTLAGVVVFALATAATAMWVVYALAHQQPLDFLWVVLLIDLLG